MTFDPSGDYDETRILLTTEGVYEEHHLEAYCSPDAAGEDYDADGNVVTEKPTDSDSPVTVPTGNWSRQQFGAPFAVDIVFTAKIPQPETVIEIRDQLGDEFEDEFVKRTEEVYEKISESDDPLDEIMDLDSDQLIVEPADDA